MSRTHHLSFAALVVLVSAAATAAGACSATNDPAATGGSGANSGGGAGGGASCPACSFDVYVECDGTETDCSEQDLVCSPELGCVECVPGTTTCVGNEVHECSEDGTSSDTVVEVCDVDAGLTCSNGACKTACQAVEDQPSNLGCEFWAVDLDQQDGAGFDPASEDWGVALSNAGTGEANVTIEINTAPTGEPAQLEVVEQISVPAGNLVAVTLPIRELDCGTVPNDYNSPGTCLSSRAFRIISSNPIVAYQFNVFENAYSNDASLLLPTKALGMQYRVIGWNAGHPVDIPFPGPIPVGVDRSYITIVGTEANTQVTVKPTWKIKGNPPIDATPAGGEITVTIDAFDVLNLETDDGALSDDPLTVADLSGSLVQSDKRVAVFSGVESTSVPYGHEIPTYPGWTSESTCCLDHLEEQLLPIESMGNKYVITRSPVRSTSGWREPDVIRFVGAAEVATVTTTLPPPYDSFTIQPGEVRTTWSQQNFTVTTDKPVVVGQYQVSQGYIDGPFIGDPDMTVFPPVDQYRTEYFVLTPGSWTQNWVVISAEVGAEVTLDGNSTSGCETEAAGTIDGVQYESRKCPLAEGVHALSGDEHFGVVTYGYGSAGSYAVVGGADVKPIYEPPPIPK